MVIRIRQGDTLAALSARLGVPGCMLLRRNGLFSSAWLLPGREIEVPSGTFCYTAEFPCPAGATRAPAGAEAEDAADETSGTGAQGDSRLAR